jgi:hypothetical protein
MPVLTSGHSPPSIVLKSILTDITKSSLYSCSLSILLYVNFNLFILSKMYDGFVNLSISSQKVLQYSCLISLSLRFALIVALLYSKNVSSALQYFHLSNLAFLIRILSSSIHTLIVYLYYLFVLVLHFRGSFGVFF